MTETVGPYHLISPLWGIVKILRSSSDTIFGELTFKAKIEIESMNSLEVPHLGKQKDLQTKIRMTYINNAVFYYLELES